MKVAECAVALESGDGKTMGDKCTESALTAAEEALKIAATKRASLGKKSGVDRQGNRHDMSDNRSKSEQEEDMWRQYEDSKHDDFNEELTPGQALSTQHDSHAPDHFREYKGDPDGLADMLDGIIMNPDEVKHLSRGRTAYWDDKRGIAIVIDPNSAHGGTAMRPDTGKDWFDNLK